MVNLTFADEGIEVVAVSSGELAERALGRNHPASCSRTSIMAVEGRYDFASLLTERAFRHVPVVLLVVALRAVRQNEAAESGPTTISQSLLSPARWSSRFASS